MVAVKKSASTTKGSTSVKKAPAVSARVVKKKAGPTPAIRVRLYRHGLGDCFLLRIARDTGDGTFNVLIDCGLISVAEDAKAKMIEVVEDIKSACVDRIDVVVMTHEHWDHASGFSAQQAREIFDIIDIGEVWYAWTEDPSNQLGVKLRREREAKLKTLVKAVAGLRAVGSPLALQRAGKVGSILQFFGLSKADLGLSANVVEGNIGKTRDAFDYLKNRRGVKVRYLSPGKEPIRLKNASGVRAYVMGPPEDEGLIKRSSPTKAGKEVYEFASEFALAESLSAAFSRVLSGPDSVSEKDRPFDSSFSRYEGAKMFGSTKLSELKSMTWDEPSEGWRKIGDDWTAAAETLALNLDSHTNNTCLVLAFEIVSSGRTLLFAADAQVGNWLSWQDVRWHVKDDDGSGKVTGPDLLKRTVFYKVGHHGSHNATLRSLGLEQMTSEELVAFIPVVRAEAVKNRWMKMPFTPLVGRLREKTGGRLIMSDDQAAPTAAALKSLPSADRDEFLKTLTVGPKKLYYEYSFS